MSVQEGLLTDTQKQMYFRQLVDLRQLGVPVSGKILADAAPIQGKTEFTEQLAQEEQQQAQQAQEAQKVQNELIDSQSKMAKAKALSDVSLSKERFTRALANLGLNTERKAEAIQNTAQASLDRAKTMKELESMDDDKLIKYMNIVKIMDELSEKKEETQKLEDVAITEASAKQEEQPQAPDQSPQGFNDQIQQPTEAL